MFSGGKNAVKFNEFSFHADEKFWKAADTAEREKPARM